MQKKTYLSLFICVMGAALVAIPLLAAFEYNYGDNKTIYPRCFNSTSGQLLGTTAKLTVRNESGIFYEVAAVENIGAGIFKTHIANLSKDHCYSLDFNCTSTDTWAMQWATICVNQSTTTLITTQNNTNFSGLGGVLAMAGMVALFIILNLTYHEKYPISQIFLVPMIMLSLMIMLFSAARFAESGGAPAAISTALDRAYTASIVSMLLVTFAAFIITFLLGLNIYKESHQYMNQLK